MFSVGVCKLLLTAVMPHRLLPRPPYPYQGLWKPYVQQLLEAMVLTGLSETLVKSLAAIADALPELREEIQARARGGGEGGCLAHAAALR